MKFTLLVTGAVFAGALAVFAIPSTALQSGTDSIQSLIAQSGLRHFSVADLNPLRFIFDFEQQQINTPLTPEQLGFHGSAVKLAPVQWPGINLDNFKTTLGPGGYDPQGYMELQQNNQRMQDMRNYMSNPMGPPPL